MPCPLYIVDAFTSGPFTGNPAAVCILTGRESPQWMQNVAAEMNLSETAFTWHLQTNEWVLRWFTPGCEVNLCGHATLATAHVLWQRGVGRDMIDFRTRSGLLSATRNEHVISLELPADSPVELPPDMQASIAGLLGVQAEWIGRGGEDVLVVFKQADDVRQLQPDLALLKTLPFRGLIVTAPGDEDGVDCVSRFFAPAAGIPEDPITGSAHCLLAVYWGQRLGRRTLRGYQASARTGVVDMALSGSRVILSGLAKTVLTGEFHG
ncbi:PhzF family phenazine biosynthesis protein [Spongiibacter tropicus]|uniref:PhzF family phenazine biosynthesis protein n=1 Tax=Spongiibacter tropicus TaxID=454602 RepID=UPI0003B4B3BD|nr:PhzF family phenazine biosynthesis protein [Spongiibacter tropicus]TNF07641.1 MAG: PhzF family phenazine biosynthesis protein [Gammaproteobacteria bacterium]